jgi:CheY-like chemotaxis protein
VSSLVCSGAHQPSSSRPLTRGVLFESSLTNCINSSTQAAQSFSLGLSVARDFPSGAAFFPAATLSTASRSAWLAVLESGPQVCLHTPERRSLIRPRILLADDHVALLEAETALLSPYFDVVGTVVDGAALVLAARRLLPDVIVTDISMPILNGIDAAYKLRVSGSTAKILFLTVHREREFVEACMEAGALGYVQKSSMKRHLVLAIQAVLAGQSYVSQSDLAP